LPNGGDDLIDEKTNKEGIINVIDEFDYSTQNDEYNEKFRSWRNRRDNIYAFKFEKNERESIYVDGRGFIDHSLEYTEKKVLANIFFTLGIAALMWVVFDDLVSKLIVSLVGFAGLNIHMNFSTSIIYGGSREVVLMLVILGILKPVIPMLYLHFKFKVPLKAEVMGKMNNTSALVGAISLAFLVCVATSVPLAYSTESKEMVAFFASSGADVAVWNQFEFILYTVFDVIVNPIIAQLLFCGAAFAVLRQFGDPFAMIITSVTAALLTQDFRFMPTVFLVTLVGCYGMLSSGSIFTAVSVNIVYKMYSMTLTLIETDSSDNMPLIRNLFMAAVVVLGSVGLAFYRMSLKKHRVKLAVYVSDMTFGRRIIQAAKTFPYSAVAILCVIYAAIKAVF